MAGSVYWVGADNNVWLKGPTGVQNLGAVKNATANGADGAFGSAEATQIADPNPPKTTTAQTTAPPTYVAGSGSGTGTVKPDKTNDIALQNAGLGAVDSQTAAGIAAIDKAFGGLTSQYDTERAANEANYNVQSDSNQNNLQKGKQTALVNAAHGRSGLMGTLASIGALSGSGVDLANRAVQTGANADLSGAADTYATNQSGLDTAIGQFKQEDDRRRQNATNAAADAKTTVNNEAAKSRQGFFSGLANDYATMGDSGNAAKYTKMAADLYPTIANTNVPSSNLVAEKAAFTPGTLGTYLARGNNTSVNVGPSVPGSTPSLVASNDNSKKKQS